MQSKPERQRYYLNEPMHMIMSGVLTVDLTLLR